MSPNIWKILAGAAAAVVGITFLIVLLWPATDDDPDVEFVTDSDASPPFPVPELWDSQNPEYEIEFQARDDLHWLHGDDRLLRGPDFDVGPLKWSEQHSEGWQGLQGISADDTVSIHTELWTAPGFPMAIIDIDAELTAEVAAEPLYVQTTVASDDAEFLTGSLEHLSSPSEADGQDILAGRFATTGPVVQLHAPHGASGRITDHSNDDISIEWTIWPGSDELTDCLDEDSPPVRTSLRLVVQFGDHPLVAPLPAPAGAESMATPIFVDAPAVTDNPWADGRARNAEDLARRFRTLAYGHSDRDDPRYGNGGLLAANMGGVFAIPDQWWDDEAIRALRRSLKDTAIEVAPLGSVDDGDKPRSFFGDSDDCSVQKKALESNPYDTTLIARSSDDRPFHRTLTAPPPAFIGAGQAPGSRDEVLHRLFEVGGDSLSSSGAYRAVILPVVATRNPLEETFSDKLLSPERHGHWTLHEDLTRKLVRHELNDQFQSRTTLSFDDIRNHHRNHKDIIAFWNPDGSLHLSPTDDPLPIHLYALGPITELDIAPQRRSTGFATWLHEPDNPATYDQSPKAVELHVK